MLHTKRRKFNSRNYYKYSRHNVSLAATSPPLEYIMLGMVDTLPWKGEGGRGKGGRVKNVMLFVIVSTISALWRNQSFQR